MWEIFFFIIVQFTTNVQLKYLTNMFCPWISFENLYKKGVISWVLKLKYMCWFGMDSKKFKPRDKT
jgi:hypothetical protein